MTEVQIRLRTVLGDIAFPVFVGVERPRVDVEIGVKFLDGDAETSGLEQFGQGGGNDAFSLGGSHASGDKDIFGGLAHKKGGMLLRLVSYGIQR